MNEETVMNEECSDCGELLQDCRCEEDCGNCGKDWDDCECVEEDDDEYEG